MNHMQHLESVALSDCAVLQMKEGTYQGSWKRAGGRSAWFMARRNLDRLITMMSPKEFPDFIKTYENVRATVKAIDNAVHYRLDLDRGEVTKLPGSIEATRSILAMLLDSYEAEDIFMKIRANPGGEDGTVLACMRDARRYFTLVEAEMIAEGVVKPETETYELEKDPVAAVAAIYGLGIMEVDSILAAERDRLNGVAAPAPQPKSGGYAAEQAARHSEMRDSLGQPIVYGDLYSWQRPEDGSQWIVKAVAPQEGKVKIEGEPAVPEDGRLVQSFVLTRTERATRPVDPVRELKPEFDKVISDGKVYEQGRPVRDPTPEERMHAKSNPLWPWHATRAEFEALVQRVGVATAFYTQRAPDVYQLNPVAYSIACPKEIAPAFTWVEHGTWVLARSKVPAELDENFPRLQTELNMKEHEDSDKDFQFMYTRDDSDGKFKLNEKWLAWGREAA